MSVPNFGPWFASVLKAGLVITADGQRVAEVLNDEYGTTGEAKREIREAVLARAQLMAAAPDLYDACVTAEFFLRTLPPDMVATLRNSSAFDAACNLRFALEEAIAKANGDEDE